MNINEVVSTNWNLGTAISEMIGSFTLIFLVFFTRYFVGKYLSKKYAFVLLSLGFTISFFISIIMAWIIGGFINGAGQVAGIVAPSRIILASFIKNSFISLPYVLGFQIIGAIIGAFSFLLVYFLLERFILSKNQIKFSDDIKSVITLESFSFGKNSVKELIFQFFFIFSVGFISYLDPIAYGLEAIQKTMINLLIIFVLLLISSKFNFFMFSFTVSLSFAILQAVFKIFKWKEFAKVLVAFAIQILISYIAALGAIGIVDLSGKRVFNL